MTDKEKEKNLIVTRRVGESFEVDGPAKITIIKTARNKAKISISAKKETKINYDKTVPRTEETQQDQ